ncbi:MAG: hypothetical protein C0489_13145, partial [Candidatus Accumulibacter sp.]|nr:hypothetical protein [Accumulibacter sp.]
DDWYLLSIFDGAQSGGVGRTIELATTQTFAARPGHGLYAALLFNLFGFDPTGYHLFNTGVIAATVVALHALLLRTGFDRSNALAVAIVFALLPQLSTVRVWYSSFQVPLAMLLGLASLHCALCFIRSSRRLWMLPAALAAWASIACYEIFAPLILLASVAPVALTLEGWKPRLNPQWRRTAPLLLLAAAVIAAMALKAAVSARTAGAGDPMRYLRIAYGIVRFDYNWRIDNGLNLYAALSVNFWHSLVGWFDAARALLTGRLGLAVTAAALGIGALSFWRLSVAGDGRDRPAKHAMLLLGIIVFATGYAVFLLLPAIVFSPTGLGNRVSVASAIGIAMILVAIIRYGAGFSSLRFRRQVAALALCLLATV